MSVGGWWEWDVCVWVSDVCVSEVIGGLGGQAGGGEGRSGCSTKNKNPTRQCGEKSTSDSFQKMSGWSLLQTHFNDISLVGTELPFNLKEALHQEEALYDCDLFPVNAADYH